MEKKQAFEIARRIGWLAETAPEFQSRVLARCDLLDLSASRSVYDEGDDAGGLYFVAAGSIGLHMHAPNGGPTLGHIAGPGFWAGDLAALTGQPRKLGIRTRAPTCLLRVTRTALGAIAAADEAAYWRNLSGLVVRSYSSTLDIFDALRRGRPAERTAATIVNLLAAGSFADPPVLQVNQTDLGAITRLSRASVNAALVEFEKRGWIDVQYGSLAVLDAEALRAFSLGQ